MPRITLDDFNDSVDKRFEDVEFDVAGGKVARFVQPLRLASEEKKQKLEDLAVRFAAHDFKDDDEILNACLEMFETMARAKSDFANMKKHLNNDPARMLVAVELLLDAYGGLEGVGEA